VDLVERKVINGDALGFFEGGFRIGLRRVGDTLKTLRFAPLWRYSSGLFQEDTACGDRSPRRIGEAVSFLVDRKKKA
jgi:hypothetical protein